jgi:hypothetical protein
MIQLSHTVATDYLQTADQYSDFYLVLGHLIGKDSKYTEFFRNTRKYKVLDNGAYENGVPLSNEDLVQASNEIRADEVVCPDVFKKGPETVAATKSFLEHIGKNPPYKLMVVPQGTTVAEWHACFAQLKALGKDYKITNIGLSFLVLAEAYKEITGIEAVYPNRLKVLSYKTFRDSLAEMGWKVHLLGLASRGGRELIEASLRPEVIRCDTSTAYHLAKKGITLNYAQRDFDREVTKLDFKDSYNEVIANAIRINCPVFNEWGRGLATAQ